MSSLIRQRPGPPPCGDLAGGGDPHCRRYLKRGAVLGHWRPVHHGIAGSAVPAGVSAAAVSEAGDVADEHFVVPHRRYSLPTPLRMGL